MSAGMMGTSEKGFSKVSRMIQSLGLQERPDTSLGRLEELVRLNGGEGDSAWDRLHLDCEDSDGDVDGDLCGEVFEGGDAVEAECTDE